LRAGGTFVQGFSTPFLMLLVMLITNDRKIMGRWINTRAMNILDWLTTAAMFAATVGLILTFWKQRQGTGESRVSPSLSCQGFNLALMLL
jgi:hypothetical protein